MAIISDAEARDIVGAAASDTLVPMLRPLVERAIQGPQGIGWDVEQATYTRYYPPHDRGAVPEWFPGSFGIVPMGGTRLQVISLDHKYVLLSGLEVREAPSAYFGQAADFDSDTILTLGSHYSLDTSDGVVSESGHLRRISSYWPRQPGSVQVTYTAGFTADELDASGGTTDASDIRLACLLQFQKAYREAFSWQKQSTTGAAGPIVSETVPGYSYTLGGSAGALLDMSRTLTPEVQELIHKYRRYAL